MLNGALSGVGDSGGGGGASVAVARVPPHVLGGGRWLQARRRNSRMGPGLGVVAGSSRVLAGPVLHSSGRGGERMR